MKVLVFKEQLAKKLWSKPNTIIWREDLYLKEESVVYSSVNPQNQHSVFTHSQLIMSFQATTLVSLFLWVATIVDLSSLYDSILSAITQDETLQEHLYYLTNCWSLDISIFLLKDGKIYVLLANNFYTCVL